MELTGVFLATVKRSRYYNFNILFLLPPASTTRTTCTRTRACNSCKPLSANGQVAIKTIKLHVKTIAGAEPQNSLNKDLKGPLLVLFNLFNVPQRKENEEIDSELNK